MTVYYTITILANIVAVIVFRKSINITALSLVPVLLMALSCFQASIFKSERSESSFDTAYGSELSSDEKNELINSGSKFLLATVPWMIPFVMFFASPVKFISVGVYLIGFIGGLAWYRINNKSRINNRVGKEEAERREQEKREELGKYK